MANLFYKANWAARIGRFVVRLEEEWGERIMNDTHAWLDGGKKPKSLKLQVTAHLWLLAFERWLTDVVLLRRYGKTLDELCDGQQPGKQE